MEQMMKVGIVTVTYNSAPVWQDFIASITTQNYKNFHLYIIDNQSSDSSVEVIKKSLIPESMTLIENQHNVGVADGNNQGIELALAQGCDAVLLLNNDTVFNENFLYDMVRSAENNQARLLVPKIYYHDVPSKIWCAGGELQLWRGYAAKHLGMDQVDNPQNNRPSWVSYSPTCAMLISRSVFADVGLMDGRYFVYCDDTDFCIRAWLANMAIFYEPSIALYHKVSSSTGLNSPFSIKMTTKNRIFMIRKFAPVYTRLYHYAINQVEYLLRVFLKGERWSEYKLRQQSFIDGLKMKF